MKVLIVDDDKLVTISLKTIIESDNDIEVVGLGSSGEEAIALYEEHKPDVLLMDIRMEGITGVDAGEEILKKYPDAKILFLTTFNDDEYLMKALNIGAKGYIIKQDFEGIIPALKTVNEGQTVFGKEVIEKIPKMINNSNNSSNNKENQENNNGDKGKENAENIDEVLREYGITSQEKEVIKLVADGLQNKEIAKELFLSEGTVRNYLSSILNKLDLRDRTNLAIFYYKYMK
ncbi:MAG: response regulator transcription factor [Lachnospiraceae bacterium]|nr:response regulator transcription factor [Lachnospiraceae bacterium]